MRIVAVENMGTSMAMVASTIYLATRVMVASMGTRVLTSRVTRVAKLMPVQSTVLATWPRQSESCSPALSSMRWTKGRNSR